METNGKNKNKSWKLKRLNNQEDIYNCMNKMTYALQCCVFTQLLITERQTIPTEWPWYFRVTTKWVVAAHLQVDAVNRKVYTYSRL